MMRGGGEAGGGREKERNTMGQFYKMIECKNTGMNQPRVITVN